MAGLVARPVVAPEVRACPWGHLVLLQLFPGRCHVPSSHPSMGPYPQRGHWDCPHGCPMVFHPREVPCPTSRRSHVPTASTGTVPRDAPLLCPTPGRSHVPTVGTGTAPSEVPCPHSEHWDCSQGYPMVFHHGDVSCPTPARSHVPTAGTGTVSRELPSSVSHPRAATCPGAVLISYRAVSPVDG